MFEVGLRSALVAKGNGSRHVEDEMRRDVRATVGRMQNLQHDADCHCHCRQDNADQEGYANLSDAHSHGIINSACFELPQLGYT